MRVLPKKAWLAAGIVLMALGDTTRAALPDVYEILRADGDGTDVELVLSRNVAEAQAGLTVHDDAVDPRLYWSALLDYLPDVPADPFLHEIRSATPDGRDVEGLLLYGNSPIAVDSLHGKIYYSVWSDCEPCGGLLRANLDGSGVETVFSETAHSGVALHPGAGTLYWANDGAIRSANLDGTDSTVLIGGVAKAWSMAVDEGAGKLYWREGSGGGAVPHRIRRADLNGSNVEDLVTGLAAESWGGLAIDPAGDRMWWADPTAGTIHRSRLDGTEVVQVLAGQDEPRYVAYRPSDGRLYFLANPGKFQPVPTVSTWGAFGLLALVLVAWAALARRPSPASRTA